MNLKYLVTYYRTKSVYAYWLAAQLIVILGLIVYTFSHYGKESSKELVISRIEAAIILIFIMEVACRIYLSRRKFFTNVWNVVDLMNLTIIVLVFGASYFVTAVDAPLIFREEIPITLLGLRYLSQVLRILVELKFTKDIREAAKIDFTFDHVDDEITNLDSPRSGEHSVDVSVH